MDTDNHLIPLEGETWPEFRTRHKGHGYSLQELLEHYSRSSNMQTRVTHSYSRPLPNISPETRDIIKRAPNPWTAFQREVAGLNYSREEVSQIYHEMFGIARTTTLRSRLPTHTNEHDGVKPSYADFSLAMYSLDVSEAEAAWLYQCLLQRRSIVPT